MSVIIPVYNVAEYIGEALKSVMAQTYDDCEVIVVNDGSTDGIESALGPFRDRIVYLKQDHRGLSAARNAALRVARGRCVAYLDGDDVWMPDFLEKLLGRLEADTGIDVIYPNAVLFGAPQWEGRLFQDVYPSREPVTYERLLTRECVVFGDLALRREALDGEYDETLQSGMDLDMWLRMAVRGARFAFVTEPLVRCRKRPDSLSSDEVRAATSVIRVYEKILGRPAATPRERELVAPLIAQLRARVDVVMSKRLIVAGDFTQAAERLSRANDHYRSFKLSLTSWGLRVAPHLLGWLMARRGGRG